MAPSAHAHPNHGLVGDRYVKLVAEDGTLRVVYSLSYGPIGAALARRSMDANQDGRLTAAESRAGARSLAALVRAQARLTLDGSEAELAWETPFVAPAAGVVDASPITIELSTTVPLAGGETVIVLEDLAGLEGIERSDYAFEARSPAELLGSGLGESATGQERLVSMLDRRVSGRRVVSMRVRLPATPLGWVGAVSFAGGMLVLGALTSLILRRRARAVARRVVPNADRARRSRRPRMLGGATTHTRRYSEDRQRRRRGRIGRRATERVWHHPPRRVR